MRYIGLKANDAMNTNGQAKTKLQLKPSRRSLLVPSVGLVCGLNGIFHVVSFLL